MKPPFGFNFFGSVSGNLGLAEAARLTLGWLLAQRQPVCLRDVKLGGDGWWGQIHTYDALVTRRFWGLPFGVNLFHLNPPLFDFCLSVGWFFLPIERRMNLVVPFWELPSLPPLWRDVLGAMDLVLAPSRFVQTIVESNVPAARILHFPIPVPTMAPTRPDRARFGLPDRGLVFLCTLDVGSDLQRKNPWAAIEAFQTSFVGQEPVCLVVKLNNSSLCPRAWPQLDRLRQIATNDRRVVLIDRRLDRADLHNLFASCDVFVSLHHAEGLGLVLMEMMSLGKPVVTTAWSGNMDFTSPDNACLVDYDMVPVQATNPEYQEEVARTAPLWADPRMATAVTWMRRLCAEPALRARIGQQAAQDMRRRADADRSGILQDIQQLLASPEVQTSHHLRARWLARRRIQGLASRLVRSPQILSRRFRNMVSASRVGPLAS